MTRATVLVVASEHFSVWLRTIHVEHLSPHDRTGELPKK